MKSSVKTSMWNQAVLPLTAVLALTAVSCSQGSGTDKAAQEAATEQYHADYDIVMVVKSLIDAVNVGEQLDSAAYSYEAVFTDGAGRPLYTDLQGTPGLWSVKLESPGNVSFSNIYLGDLLPSDLETYLIAGLPLTEKDRLLEMPSSDEKEMRRLTKDKELSNSVLLNTEGKSDDNSDLASLNVYNIGNGVLRFETRTGRTPSGLEGPLMTIRVIAN